MSGVVVDLWGVSVEGVVLATVEPGVESEDRGSERGYRQEDEHRKTREPVGRDPEPVPFPCCLQERRRSDSPGVGERKDPLLVRRPTRGRRVVR